MRFLAFQILSASLLFLSAIQAQALDPNVCNRPTNKGHLVQNINSQDVVSVIQHRDAVKLFNELKSPKYKIPYYNAYDNCDARGHRISQILHSKYKLSTMKVFVEAINEEHYGAGAPSFTWDSHVDDGSRVTLNAVDILGQNQSWSYHTAPGVCVRKNGKDELYIFDLSLFHEPVPYSVWKNKMTSGLSESSYKVTSTNMYSMIRQDEHQPAKQAFEKWETEMMNEGLKGDWAGHTRHLQKGSRVRSTQTTVRSKTIH